MTALADPIVVDESGRPARSRRLVTSVSALGAVAVGGTALVLGLWPAGVSPWAMLAVGAAILFVVAFAARILVARSAGGEARYLRMNVRAAEAGHGRVVRLRPAKRVGGLGWSLKRASDQFFAPILLVVSLPLWLIVMLAIKLESRGPALFCEWRVGRHGRLFRMYKFRCRVEGAVPQAQNDEDDGPASVTNRDPRVTRVGRVIRRRGLDKLPQLINVVLGEMSVVGPGPACIQHVASCEPWALRRFEVPPGITGLWQVSGDSARTFEEAARLDVLYADNWSAGKDFRILARTVPAVLSGRGAR